MEDETETRRDMMCGQISHMGQRRGDIHFQIDFVVSLRGIRTKFVIKRLC